MDIDDFEDQVDRWGEDVSAWPEPSRTQALALLEVSEEARAVVAEAAALRKALAARPAVRAPADLADRIFAAARAAEPEPRTPVPIPSTAPPPTAPPRSRWLAVLASSFGQEWRPAVVLSACFLLGLASSFMTVARSQDDGGLGFSGSLFQEFR
ncbi:hypothetical protein PQJ75_27265 [Rhodoplanes sp. TEM]|uniref:Uncharacterized protein n=1 Tax=Rhodoplanes tepidamans TaxID=200616 RepID=A0ABT5JBZ1_RHOTP|nr:MULTISPECIES: hypothetical protein [Rhodoplanes]MDC7786784.1 hypothetical protein [Rhodoplanes tepidamans]MDC7987450.1 hypothetical protein [Rhodoplanes sp. TEM]MDQ0356340.1 hypothetical protein [Rhodoplanes tepidamans]